MNLLYGHAVQFAIFFTDFYATLLSKAKAYRLALPAKNARTLFFSAAPNQDGGPSFFTKETVSPARAGV